MARITLSCYLRLIFVMCIFAVCDQDLVSQTLSKKDASLFKKAEKQFVTGKYVDAEKNYTQIVLSNEHGRSLKRLGDIEALVRSNSAKALTFYTRALEALKEDLVKAQAGGDMAVISEAEEWLGACEKGISTCGGEIVLSPDNEIPTSEKQLQAYSDSVYAPKTIVYGTSISMEPDGIFLVDMGKKVTFYQNAAVTSYFAYMENPIPSCSIPTANELKAILTAILQSSERANILSGLDWDERESIEFISNDTFFDDVNDHKCKAFSITKDSIIPQETSVDFGGMSSVLLIK